MKYVRTKDEIIPTQLENGWVLKGLGSGIEVISQADTIEELCDCYAIETETTKDFNVARIWKLHNLERKIYGCIKTNKGLIYVAKMNDNGELELL